MAPAEQGQDKGQAKEVLDALEKDHPIQTYLPFGGGGTMFIFVLGREA